MSITDAQFRIGVAILAAALVAAIVVLRFSGPVTLPPRPPPPSPVGTSSELLTRSSASPVVYRDFIARDAAAAGVRAPTLDELARKLPYRSDRTRHVLEVGQPPLESAGVRLRALRVEPYHDRHDRDHALALEIANATGSDIAYRVVSTQPAAECSTAPAVAFNAMIIRHGGSETRIECVWRAGRALVITQIETIEVPPLSAWYLDHVPPSAVGIEPRIARGHREPEGADRCAFALPQSVRSGLEREEIGWRDLVDFYARHRCQTYHFPLLYRAFSSDGERSVPAVPPGM